MYSNKLSFYYNVAMQYPDVYKHRPSHNYPEYVFWNDLQENNEVYEGVREAFRLQEYDLENYGTPSWNPLGHLIQPGNNVLIKPNLVMHKNMGTGGDECLYTHVSVVAAVIDYVIIALKGIGKIVIADAPMQNCDFDVLKKQSGYENLIEYYQSKDCGVFFELRDLRGVIGRQEAGILVHEYRDSEEGIRVELGEESEFALFSEDKINKMRITNYDPELLQQYHNSKSHSYEIAKTVLDADVIINMPKIKTHRKAGVTLSLKNIVGIVHRKECLPHHTIGDKMHGGDEYREPSRLKTFKALLLDRRNHLQEKNAHIHAKIIQLCIRALQRIIRYSGTDGIEEGSWCGNTTIPYTIVDLNNIIQFADRAGKMTKQVQRKMLIVGDMVTCGELNGPLCPSPKKIGAIAIAESAVVFDTIIAKLMGAKIEKIPTLEIAKKSMKTPLNIDETMIRSNDAKFDLMFAGQLNKEDSFGFRPISEWKDAFIDGYNE